MNIGNVVANAVAKVAPTVAGAMGGPLAGKVVREVSEALTGRPDAPEALLRDAVLDMGPDQAAALQSLEAEYTERLRMSLEDRSDARRREIETGDWTSRALAFLIISAAIAFNFVPIFVVPAPEVARMLDNGSTLFEILTVAVVSYYFGSSMGSKNKERIIARGQK